MRRTILVLSLFMLVSLGYAVNVIPYPYEYSVNPTENYILSDTSAIVCRQKSLIPIAEIFAKTVRQSTGLELPVEKNSIRPIYVEVDKFIKHPEYYQLIVSKSAIEIYGGSPTAIYYGLQTLLQFFPPQIESPVPVRGIRWTVPAMVIEDFPKYDYRGIHMDVARHFMPISHLKKQIDLMSKFKLNRLHLHLTDDQGWRIEIKKYPKLTQVGAKRKKADGSVYDGGYYTQEELADLVRYASLRGVTIIPEIEMPGHAMAALAAYPQFGCTGGPYEVRSVWGIEEHLLCAGNESVYKFIEDILTEVASIFPSEYIHVGGDECPTNVWHKCPKCRGLMKQKKIRSEVKLYGYFMNRVANILHKLDRKMIGWDEIVKGGVSASSATAMFWHGEDKAIKAVRRGYYVIMTPWKVCYLDHYQGSKLFEPMAIGGYTTVDEIYDWSPMPDTVGYAYRTHILGGQANLWSEYIYTPEHAEEMLYPRLLAFAETMWTQCAAKDSISFHARLDSIYARLDYADIHYHIPLPEGQAAQYIEFVDSVCVNLGNNLKYPIFYSVDDESFLRYDSAFSIKLSCNLKAYSTSPTGRHSDTVAVEYRQLKSHHAAEQKPLVKGLYRQRAYGYYPNAHGIDDIDFGTKEIVDSLMHNPVDSYTRPWIEIYDGYFNVDSTDFYLITADAEELWVDGVCIVDNNDKIKRNLCNRAVMGLEKGKHSFRFIYNNCVNDGFPAIWRKPVIKLRSVSDNKFHAVSAEEFYR